ncbi:unnamed protein product, partial [Adineta steineri]
LKAGQSRVLYLCGGAWVLAGLLSTPNAFLFHLHVNGSVRYCTAVFNHQSTPTLRRIYLTFISLVVYFMPFLVLVFCYALIFVKLLCREHDQQEWSTNKQSPSSCCSSSWKTKMITFTNIMNSKTDRNSSSSRSSFSDHTIRLK